MATCTMFEEEKSGSLCQHSLFTILYHNLLEVNKVSVYTENPGQAKVAQENGAAVVGGADLVQRILDYEVDFYVVVLDIISKLLPLKNELGKEVPQEQERGSVGVDIPKMLELFQTCHEYIVEKERCHHQRRNGHFIERAIGSCQMSEDLLFKSEELVQKVTVKKDDLRCL
ncbi:large ribosomal subunit protein uL1m-like [Salvelinus alpinus]